MSKPLVRCPRCGQAEDRPTAAGILAQSYNALLYAVDRSVSGPPLEAKQRHDTVRCSIAGSSLVMTEGAAMAVAEIFRLLAAELTERALDGESAK